MADSKLTDLTADTTPADSDLLYVVADPSGTPADRKSTIAQVVTAMVLDEDDMASDSATKVPTQQSVKAYVDAAAGGTVDVVSNVASGVLLGRTTAGSGNSEELTAAQVGTLFSGTSFPGSPSDRQTFFRTDRDIQYFYDLANTRWLSVQEYVTQFPVSDESVDTGHTATANAGRSTIPYRGTYSILLTRFQVQTLVLTTNNGSNYWTIKLNWATAADADTQIGTTMDTTAHTAGQNYDQFISPNAVVDSTARQLKLRVDKVSAPGGLFVNGLFHYRLVG